MKTKKDVYGPLGSTAVDDIWDMRNDPQTEINQSNWKVPYMYTSPHHESQMVVVLFCDWLFWNMSINLNIIYAKYYLYVMKLREKLPNFKVVFEMKKVIQIC